MALGGEAAGDAAAASTASTNVSTSADTARVLSQPQEEEAPAAVAAAVDAAAKELLPPEAQSTDAPTTATLEAATEQSIEEPSGDTECAISDLPVSDEPVEKVELVSAPETDATPAMDASDAQSVVYTPEDEKKKGDDVKSWASAIPSSIQKFQEKKGELIDGASGSMLSKANWSKNFQLTITQMIAAGAAATTTAKSQLHDALSEATAAAAEANAPIAKGVSVQQNASTRVQLGGNDQSAAGNQSEQQQTAVGEKRKRELSSIDVILIDSDSDEGDRMYKEAQQNLGLQARGSVSSSLYRNPAAATAVAHANGVRATQPVAPNAYNAQQQTNGAHVQRFSQQQHQYSVGRSQSGIPTPSTSPTTASSSTNFSRMPNQNQTQVAALQSMAIEPFNRQSALVNSGLQNLGIRQVASSSAYEIGNSSSLNNNSSSMNGMMMQPPVVEPVTASYLPPVASTPVDVPASRQSMDGWENLNDSNIGAPAPDIQAPMGGMQYGDGGGVNGFAMDNGAAGTHSMGMAPLTAMSTPTTSNLLATTTSDWTANPMEDILYGRYYQINLYTVNMEQNIKALNDRIMQVSTQNLQMAQQLSMTLKSQQGLLQKSQLSRVHALIALVVQSHSIMKKVKRLRMDTLSDIAVVVEVSHRKCVELSQQITIYANNIATLHQQMAMTLDSANVMNPDAFHQSVSTINQAIQGNEQSIRGWKEERENEIVRIVQYSNLVREELKRAFHQQKQTSASSSQPQPQYPNQQQWQHQQTSNGFRR